MVKHKVIQIMLDNLKEYIEIDDIKFLPSNGILKYVLNISNYPFKNYSFEIVYYFMDNYYTIRLEKYVHNRITDVVFLTKSKKFKKDIKLTFKELKLSKKVFENHINAFCVYLSKVLEKYGNLDLLEDLYISDMKFDGIFLGVFM